MLNRSTKIYFASDFHLGAPNAEESREREFVIIQWLDQIKKDATEIFLVGDLFDFWFTYNKVIPKGFIRFQGKLAELVDSGIRIHVFSGNHDLWGTEYFEKEIGVTIYNDPIERSWNQKKFYIGHGDGLGPGDYTYKKLKKYVFLNPFTIWAFKNLHPDWGIALAQAWSGKSRTTTKKKEIFRGEEFEWLAQYSKDILNEEQEQKKPLTDYFIFGHRHLTLDIKLQNGARYINLGEWIHNKSYAVFDGEALKLEYWKG